MMKFDKFNLWNSWKTKLKKFLSNINFLKKLKFTQNKLLKLYFRYTISFKNSSSPQKDDSCSGQEIPDKITPLKLIYSPIDSALIWINFNTEPDFDF